MSNPSPQPTLSKPIFVIGSLVVACSAQVPRWPDAGETLLATDFLMETGGKGFNVALAAHRLGIEVDGLFAVGADAAAIFARQSFDAAGLSPDLVLTLGGPTGAGVGLIDPSGENRIAVFPGANARLAGTHVRAAAVRLNRAGLVFGQFEAPDAAILEAFVRAREAELPTLLNPSPYRQIATALLEATDIMVVNQSEAAVLAADLGCLADRHAKDAYSELASELSDRGVDTLIVTLGAEGAVLWKAGRCQQHDGFAVAVVDSIGAGDAFTGALIASLAQGLDLTEALRRGCAAGALAVSRGGVIGALPNQEELAAFLADRADP